MLPGTKPKSQAESTSSLIEEKRAFLINLKAAINQKYYSPPLASIPRHIKELYEIFSYQESELKLELSKMTGSQIESAYNIVKGKFQSVNRGMNLSRSSDTKVFYAIYQKNIIEIEKKYTTHNELKFSEEGSGGRVKSYSLHADTVRKKIEDLQEFKKALMKGGNREVDLAAWQKRILQRTDELLAAGRYADIKKYIVEFTIFWPSYPQECFTRVLKSYHTLKSKESQIKLLQFLYTFYRSVNVGHHPELTRLALECAGIQKECVDTFEVDNLLRHSFYTLYQQSNKKHEQKESTERASKIKEIRLLLEIAGKDHQDEAMQKISCFIAIVMPFFLHQLYCLDSDMRMIDLKVSPSESNAKYICDQIMKDADDRKSYEKNLPESQAESVLQQKRKFLSGLLRLWLPRSFLELLYCLSPETLNDEVEKLFCLAKELLLQAHHDLLMSKEDYKWRENDRPPAGAAEAINLAIIEMQKIEACAKEDFKKEEDIRPDGRGKEMSVAEFCHLSIWKKSAQGEVADSKFQGGPTLRVVP